MTVVSEKPHQHRLDRSDVVIETDFWDERRVKTRRTDAADNQDIFSGVIMSKRYYLRGQMKHTERTFSPLIQYSFVMRHTPDEQFTCPNCGHPGIAADPADSCPFCGTYYNVVYANRQDAGKFSGEKKAKALSGYAIPFVIILALCMGIAAVTVYFTSRTFGLFDVLKGLIFGGVAGLTLFFVYYSINAFVIVRKAEQEYIRQTKEIERFRADLMDREITLNQFYTNLNSELVSYFYNDAIAENKNIVDFDILDYTDYGLTADKEGRSRLDVSIMLRLVRLENEKMSAATLPVRVTMGFNDLVTDALRPGVNLIRCHRCGASIDVTKPQCEYCGAPVKYKQRLYLTELFL